MNSRAPKVSFLLLNWNGIAYTRVCLRSLLKTTYPNFEIILVDNGSDHDEGKKLASEFGKKISVIRHPVNAGYAEGMNIAYQHSTGQYIMVLNNDMEFPTDWLQPLVDVLEKNSRVGACQPKICDIANKKEFEYASAAGGFVDIFGYPFARGRIFVDVEKDVGQYDENIRVSWAGIMLIRKSLIASIGFFDSIFFNYGEDMDLCMRIYRAGKVIVNVPRSIVYHVGGGTLKKNLRKKMFYHHRNNLIFILKNWPIQLLLLVLVPRILLDVITGVYYITQRFWAGYMALIESYISLVGMLSVVLEHRAHVQTQHRAQNLLHMPLYKGSIVWDYFIRGKKKFSDIIRERSFYDIKVVT